VKLPVVVQIIQPVDSNEMLFKTKSNFFELSLRDDFPPSLEVVSNFKQHSGFVAGSS
jgi:hypothetical protein